MSQSAKKTNAPLRAVLPAVLVALLAACGGGGQRALSPGEVRAQRVVTLPSDPADPLWERVPVHVAQLLPQDVVEPRQLEATTAEVEAQAVTDGTRVVFRMTWAAPSRSDRTGPAQFSDACAVQLPADAATVLPNPMMGEAEQTVEISYWRAAWQATVDGRPEELATLYPNAKVDHYPFEAASLAPGSTEQVAMAKRFAPALAVGNAMAGPRDRPVQDLVGTGPGTLRPRSEALSTGSGKATPAGWAVIIERPLPKALRAGGRSQVAFAVWQGARQDVGARKMRTGWIPLAVEAAR